MVVTFAPSICQTKTVHALTALPSTSTTQAPHWDVSQPTCVPVSRKFSRRNCTRSVRGSTSPVTALPFTVSATAVMALLLEIRPRASFSHRPGRPPADRGKIGAILPRDAHWNKSSLNLWRTAGQGRPADACVGIKSGSSRLRYRRSEFDEEVVGGLLRRAVDQTLPELGELATDLRLHVVGEERAAVLVAERHLGAALREPSRATLPFAGNAIAVRRIEVGETDLALPARLHGPDLDRGDGLEFAVGNFLELLAARDAALEHLGIVELGPHHLAARGELDLPAHGHRHRPSPSFATIRYRASPAQGECAFPVTARLWGWRAACRPIKEWPCEHRRGRHHAHRQCGWLRDLRRSGGPRTRARAHAVEFARHHAAYVGSPGCAVHAKLSTRAL